MEKTSTKKRPYKEKESYKWQKTSEQMALRLGDTQSRVISVCDREADIWQYLDYKVRQGERFVIRAAHDRCFEEGSMFDLPTTFAQAGSHTLGVLQKGGRAARQVKIFISYSPVELKHPYGSEKRLPMTYICCREEAESGTC